MNTVSSYWNNTSDAWNIFSSNFNIMDSVPFLIILMCCVALIIFICFLKNTAHDDIKKRMILLGGPANGKICQNEKYVVFVNHNEVFRNVYIIYKRDGHSSFAYPVLDKKLNDTLDEIREKYGEIEL